MGNELGIDGLADPIEIGVGGFATVYAARDEVFGRRVAVKVLQSADADALRRFRRELELMGSLADHDHIVTPYRSGESAQGHPYVVMEYLGGGSLADVLDDRGSMPWPEAVGLIAPVAQALQSAHQGGVVHLDVKPANILLSDDGVPKLTDFGIAVLQESTVTLRAFTLTHTAPETFASGEDQRDHRSDLYSLASSLFTLATGAAPFAKDGFDSMEAHMVRILTHDVPPSGLGHEHDMFFAVALAKEPADRFQSADAFLAALTLVGTGAASDETRVAVAPGPTSGSGPTVAGRAPYPAPVVDPAPTVDPDPPMPTGRRWATLGVAGLAVVAAAGGGVWGASQLTGDTATTSTAPPLAAEATTPSTVPPPAVDDPLVLSGHVNVVNKLVMVDTADGLRLASGSSTGLIRLWDPSANDAESALLQGHVAPVWFMTVLGDGRLASASGDMTIHVWDLDDPSAEPVVLRGHTGDVYDIVQLSDGRLATGGLDGSVRVWPLDDADGEALVLSGHDGAVSSLIELSDGRLATSGTDGAIRFWDLTDPAVEPILFTGHEGQIWKVIALSDGRLASTGDDGTVRIWNPGEPTASAVVLSGHETRARDIVQLPDGRLAASATDGAIRIWDLAMPTAEPVLLDDHTEAVQGLLVLSDGRLASAGTDDTVRIWDLAMPTAEPIVYDGHTDGVLTLVELPDGRVASAGFDTDVHVWSPTTG